MLAFCAVYFDHCIVCPSNYSFWLPLWNIQICLFNCNINFSILYLISFVIFVLFFFILYYITFIWTNNQLGKHQRLFPLVRNKYFQIKFFIYIAILDMEKGFWFFFNVIKLSISDNSDIHTRMAETKKLVIFVDDQRYINCHKV